MKTATLVSYTAAVALVLRAGAADAPVELSRSAYLMGTRVTLVARAADRPSASRTLEALLRSLEESEAALSTWRRDTTLGRVNAAAEEQPTSLDPELCRMFRELVAWREKTDGAFDPAVGPLVDAWGIEREPRVPSEAEIAHLLRVSQLPAWRFDSRACTVTRPPGGRLDSGAFGKGAAFDTATHLDVPARGWLIDLGGQVGVHGETPPDGWEVGIADPRDREKAGFAVRLDTGSLATSGGSERDRRVGQRRIGHILDPRTGYPAAFNGSVVVWHERGLVADILSTALYVMGPEAGLKWAEDRGIAAAYLMTHEGASRMAATRAWRSRWGVPRGLVLYTGVSGIGLL